MAARRKYTHICPQCGNPFTPHRRRQLCCSQPCSATYRVRQRGQQIDCTCQQCGKGFQVRASYIPKGGGKFCSVECKAIASRAGEARACVVCNATFRATPVMMTRNYQTCSATCRAIRQRTAEERECEFCGRAFMVAPSDLIGFAGKKPSTGRFCSRACSNAGHRKGTWGICRMCSNPIYRTPGQIHKGTHLYCSRGCANLGACKPDAEKRGFEQRTWRNVVLARDGHTCQHCGQEGGVLNAHHIKEWGKYPELRLNPDNGVTLCWHCHQEAHGNTPKLTREDILDIRHQAGARPAHLRSNGSGGGA